MSEYNYLQNIDDEREFINDDVAAEFDVLNDDIIKFTEGRGEIVYTVMLEDEKRILAARQTSHYPVAWISVESQSTLLWYKSIAFLSELSGAYPL